MDIERRMDVVNCYNLGGHSGCQIYLMEDDSGNMYVRKISKDIDYNDRLKVQSDKQSMFKGKSIYVPAVLQQGYTSEGLFYFDMEYVQGITLAEYIKTMKIGKIAGLVEALVSSLVPDSDSDLCGKQNFDAQRIFSAKFSSLRECVSTHKNHILDNALALLEAHDWSKMTASPCHGDLTLENIIVKNDRLYFIDFLDSFYDSWFLDVGTLLQDVQVMWSYRFQKETNMNTILRLIVFRDLLLDAIEKFNPSYVTEVYYALLQKLVRIYPYTKDEQTYKFLDEKLYVVMKQIQKLETMN